MSLFIVVLLKIVFRFRFDLIFFCSKFFLEGISKRNILLDKIFIAEWYFHGDTLFLFLLGFFDLLTLNWLIRTKFSYYLRFFMIWYDMQILVFFVLWLLLKDIILFALIIRIIDCFYWRRLLIWICVFEFRFGINYQCFIVFHFLIQLLEVKFFLVIKLINIWMWPILIKWKFYFNLSFFLIVHVNRLFFGNGFLVCRMLTRWFRIHFLRNGTNRTSF